MQEDVRRRLTEALRRSGRGDEVTIVAVTKGRSAAECAQLISAGRLDLGENRVQELITKREALAAIDAVAAARVRWHFVGRLQRNKVKYVAPFIHLIHSVDSVELAREIDRRAREHGRRIPILIQVNVSGEASKAGFVPSEVGAVLDQLGRLDALEVRGLMTIAPEAEDPERSRPYFERLREIAEAEAQAGRSLPELSMGMSADFEVAVEEGATVVRIGRALFESATENLV